jgi:hypothetical protein
VFALGTAIASEDPDRALQLFEECAALLRAGATDAVFGQVLGLLALGRARSDPIGALEALREALLYDYQGGLRTELVTVLDRGFRVFARVGQPETAAVLAGAVTGHFSVMSIIPAGEAEDQHAAMKEVRAHLGSERYERAVARGTAMSYEDVVGFMNAELERLLSSGQTGAERPVTI